MQNILDSCSALWLYEFKFQMVSGYSKFVQFQSGKRNFVWFTQTLTLLNIVLLAPSIENYSTFLLIAHSLSAGDTLTCISSELCALYGTVPETLDCSPSNLAGTDTSNSTNSTGGCVVRSCIGGFSGTDEYSY